MTRSEILLAIALCAETAFGFPQGAVAKRSNVAFDPKAQYVSNMGIHKFVPPNFAAGDRRGPCPGLNALANHGYIPHSGIVSIEDIALGTLEGVGLGEDVGQAFGVYGAFVSGDGLKWSLGGPPADDVSLAPGLLGKPRGISYSHNEYESDGFATRDDLYQYGNDYELNMGFFKELYDALPADSIDTLSTHRGTRVAQSIANNPYFFNGPFTGVAVAGGANSFVFRLMANKSAEYPEGLLSKDDLKAWYGVTGPDDNLKANPGQERIPDGWYKRNIADTYTIPFVARDLAQYLAEHPETASVGGNTGKVNSFTGVNINDLTGGVYNAKTLTQGNNLACFAFQAGAMLSPDILSNLLADVNVGVAAITKAFNTALAPLGCPNLQTINGSMFEQYPGYSKLKKNGEYKI